MRFTAIELERWRNFSHVAMTLQTRAFLVGPNAVGKSNLLDAFRFLRDLAAVGGGLQEAVRRRGGVSRLHCLATPEPAAVRLRARLGDDARPGRWTYELAFREDRRGRAVLERECVLQGERCLLDRPLPEDTRDPERLTQTFLEQVTANQPFREIAGFLASVCYLHLIPQLVREPERSAGHRDDVYGGDFLERLERAPARARAARFRRIQEALRAAVPQLSELTLRRDPAGGAPHLESRASHWRDPGAALPESALSDGTLRLLGLLWALLDGDGPLILEEPEQSLHPDVIRYLPQLFLRAGSSPRRGARQILVATHSPHLLHDEGIGLDEVFLLAPGAEGTSVRAVAEDPDLPALIEQGVSLADVIMARTRPGDAERLALFGG